MNRTKRPKRNVGEMPTVGIDLGETTSYATIWEDERGETFPFPVTSGGYALLKQKLRPDARIVCRWAWQIPQFWASIFPHFHMNPYLRRSRGELLRSALSIGITGVGVPAFRRTLSR